MRPVSGRSGTRRRNAFTLIELMLVVAVIAIVAALAIPSLVQGRKSANEGSTVSALRTLTTAQLWYRRRFEVYGTLPDLVAAGCVDESWGDLLRSGYVFDLAVSPDGVSWAAVAEPQTPGVTGDRFFYVDDSGVIRYRDGAPATLADAAID